MPHNCSIYLLAIQGKEYIQYPGDPTETMFRSWILSLRYDSQIALQREGNLAYHCYFRRMEDSHVNPCFLGIVACFNGEYCLDIGLLFDAFEYTVTRMALMGKVVSFSGEGNIVVKGENFSVGDKDAAWVRETLLSKIQDIPSEAFRRLPVLDLSSSLGSFAGCNFLGVKNDLPVLLGTKSRILIPSEGREDISGYEHYSEVLNEQNRRIRYLVSKNEQLDEQKSELENRISSLSRQKKQVKLVAILSVAMLLMGIGILLSISQASGLKSDLSDKQRQIEALISDIDSKKTQIMSLEKSIREKDTQISNHESFIRRFSSSLVCPFSISDIEVKTGDTEYGERIPSEKTTYIYPRFTVHSLINGEAKIDVKFFTPYGMSYGNAYGGDYTYSSTINLKKDASTTAYVSGWGGSDKGHWRSGSYRIELWYNGICIAKKSFQVY